MNIAFSINITYYEKIYTEIYVTLETQKRNPKLILNYSSDKQQLITHFFIIYF